MFSKLLQERDVTAYAVSKATGVSQSTLSDWKNGKSVPKIDKLKLIADFFGVPLEAFTTPEGNAAPDPGKTFNIPVFESVSAGFGAYASSAVIDRIPMFFVHETDAQATIAVKVCGDSMYPTIEDGDTVVVRKTDTVDSGTVAVVLCEDEGYIKKIEYTDNKVILRSINPMYPPITFEGSDILRLRVVGKVIKVIKDFE